MKCFCVLQAKVLRFNNIDCQLVQTVSLPWLTYQLFERQSWAIKNHISQIQMHPYCHFIQNPFFHVGKYIGERGEVFFFFPLPTIFSLLAKLREIYIAHKLAAVSWLKSYMQHSFQHQSIIIRSEHIAFHFFVLCLRCKAPGKHHGKIQLPNKQQHNEKKTVLSKDNTLWFETGKRIGKLEPRRGERSAAEVTTVLAVQWFCSWYQRGCKALRSTCCTKKSSPHVTKHRVLHHSKASSAWKACGSCHLSAKHFSRLCWLVACWRDVEGTLGLGDVSAEGCVAAPVPGTVHIMLSQAACMQSPWLVALVWTPGNHLNLISQHDVEGLQARINPTSFSRNLPNQNILQKQPKSISCSKKHTTHTVRRDFWHQMTPSMGFSALWTSEALPMPLLPTSYGSCMHWVCTTRGNGTWSSISRFCLAEHIEFCLIHRES